MPAELAALAREDLGEPCVGNMCVRSELNFCSSGKGGVPAGRSSRRGSGVPDGFRVPLLNSYSEVYICCLSNGAGRVRGTYWLPIASRPFHHRLTINLKLTSLLPVTPHKLYERLRLLPLRHCLLA